MRLIDADAIEYFDMYMSDIKCFEKIVRKEQIDAMPTVERKHGHWIVEDVEYISLSYGGDYYVPHYRCSCCGHYYDSYGRYDRPIMPEDADFPNYCERCGAKMDEVNKDENL